MRFFQVHFYSKIPTGGVFQNTQTQKRKWENQKSVGQKNGWRRGGMRIICIWRYESFSFALGVGKHSPLQTITVRIRLNFSKTKGIGHTPADRSRLARMLLHIIKLSGHVKHLFLARFMQLQESCQLKSQAPALFVSSARSSDLRCLHVCSMVDADQPVKHLFYRMLARNLLRVCARFLMCYGLKIIAKRACIVL